MTQRWGKDAEERSACVRKAHDAYAAAREALGKIAALDGTVLALREDLREARGEIEMLRRQISVTPVPRVVKQTRKAA